MEAGLQCFHAIDALQMRFPATEYVTANKRADSHLREGLAWPERHGRKR
jgi:hypothetical protein